MGLQGLIYSPARQAEAQCSQDVESYSAIQGLGSPKYLPTLGPVSSRGPPSDPPSCKLILLWSFTLQEVLASSLCSSVSAKAPTAGWGKQHVIRKTLLYGV